MLDRVTDRRRAAGARQRRSRARRRAGLVLLKVEADEHRLAEALIACGRVTAAEGLQRSRIEQEVSELVQDWITRWEVTRSLANRDL
jgi:hypothetical protein